MEFEREPVRFEVTKNIESKAEKSTNEYDKRVKEVLSYNPDNRSKEEVAQFVLHQMEKEKAADLQFESEIQDINRLRKTR